VIIDLKKSQFVGSMSSLVSKSKSFLFAFSILSLKFCSLLFYAGMSDLATTGNQPKLRLLWLLQ
jgi:hypothetical protein